MSELVTFARELGVDTREFVTRKVAPLLDRLDAVEKRLAEVERRPALKYTGPYRNGDCYQPGCLVSRNGGLCLRRNPRAAFLARLTAAGV